MAPDAGGGVPGPRLDLLAQVLAGTVTAVAGLLTLVGANSDRMWALLDDDRRRLWLVGAGVLAAAAITLCLVALVQRHGPRWQAFVLSVAGLTYLGALVLALVGAAEAADTAGRPTYREVRVEQDATGTSVSFVVTAVSVDPDQLVSLRVTTPADGTVLLHTVLRPDGLGAVHHEATVRVPPGTAGNLVVRAVRTDERVQECPETDALTRTGASCLVLQVPSSVP